VALACAVLLGSAALRRNQAERISKTLDAQRHAPAIKLASVPLDLGPWKGQDTDLDPLIARATGSDQIVTRRYVNQQTGATIDAILLYGPAVEVYLHAPEVCYPAAGYAQVAGPETREIKAGALSAPFRSLVYSKGEGGPGELQEVYYSWWYNGRWNAATGVQKRFERIASMYKVQLARRVNPGEKRDVGNPCESLLRELLPDLDRRMSAKTLPPS
jgi:EpsI family protein